MIVIVPDTRSLSARVRVIARQYDAIATGARKMATRSAQDADNAARDAKTLHDAADRLDKL